MSGRLPTQPRAVATRARILDTAVAIVAERGLPATTTTAICERAGVSRGTLLHHFPTRDGLIAAALDHGFANHAQTLTALDEDPEATSDGEKLDALWAMVSSPGFGPWLELAAAARTDEHLRGRAEALSRLVATIGHEHLGWRPRTVQLVVGLMNGLMLDEMLGFNREQTRQVLALLPSLVALSESS